MLSLQAASEQAPGVLIHSDFFVVLSFNTVRSILRSLCSSDLCWVLWRLQRDVTLCLSCKLTLLTQLGSRICKLGLQHSQEWSPQLPCQCRSLQRGRQRACWPPHGRALSGLVFIFRNHRPIGYNRSYFPLVFLLTWQKWYVYALLEHVVSVKWFSFCSFTFLVQPDKNVLFTN